jgi:hypothetical protein
MRNVLIVGLVLMLSVMLVAGVNAQTEEEPRFTVPGLPEGEAVAHEFTSRYDGQIFAFNGSEGDEVTITMVQEEDSALDPLLVLLGQAGQVIAFNDDKSGADVSLSSAIEDVELPMDGTYFVLATTFVGLNLPTDTDEQSYMFEITASGFTTPADMEVDRYRYLGQQLEVGASAPLLISEAEPVYFVTFEGAEDATVNIRTVLGSDSDSVTDTLLYLFDPTGTRIAVNDDSTGLAAELLDTELPTDGVYMIWATSLGYQRAAEDSLSNFGTFEIVIEEA